VSEKEAQKITIFPNPFNKETAISISGGEISRQLRIEIFSADGTPVRTITVPAGVMQVIWDGKTSGGADAAKGLYIIRVSQGQKYAVQKVIRR
jgi:flagellar hook assembly protein FlgD